MALPFADLDPYTGDFAGMASRGTEREKVGVYVSHAVRALDGGAANLQRERFALAVNDLRVARDAINRALRVLRA